MKIWTQPCEARVTRRSWQSETMIIGNGSDSKVSSLSNYLYCLDKKSCSNKFDGLPFDPDCFLMEAQSLASTRRSTIERCFERKCLNSFLIVSLCLVKIPESVSVNDKISNKPFKDWKVFGRSLSITRSISLSFLRAWISIVQLISVSVQRWTNKSLARMPISKRQLFVTLFWKVPTCRRTDSATIFWLNSTPWSEYLWQSWTTTDSSSFVRARLRPGNLCWALAWAMWTWRVDVAIR